MLCAVGSHEAARSSTLKCATPAPGIASNVIPTCSTVRASRFVHDAALGGNRFGLSIVRRLIESDGWDSRRGQRMAKARRCLLTLSLEPSENSTTLPVIANAHGRRIFIVDDNATHRRVIGDQLTHAGLRNRECERRRKRIAVVLQQARRSAASCSDRDIKCRHGRRDDGRTDQFHPG